MWKRFVIFTITCLQSANAFVVPSQIPVLHKNNGDSSRISRFSHTTDSSIIEIVKCLEKEIGKEVVKSTSSFLPEFDSIGHHILHANEKIIDMVLHSTLPEPIQKQIVLFSIHVAQNGDNMGSHILEAYRALVEACL